MYNESILAKLSTCLDHIDTLEKYFNNAQNAEQFYNSDDGLRYDATLMRLQALGENLKRIANKHPLVIRDLDYPEIESVIRFRDYVSHHYEQLEHEVVFIICFSKIPELKVCIKRLLNEK